VTYAADAFFDFDKSVLKPEGKAKLDDLASKVKAINLEVIISVGHTDSVGSDAYNQKLSVRRAEAVKAYLVSKGIEKNRVYTEGKGEKQPVADNKTAEGRAKLDDLVGKIKGISLEVIIAVGHTDSVGSDAYNQKLSVNRAEAVKAYLVSKGIEKNRVYTEGKGEKQPVADNKTAEGRAKNRRVEIEVVGTRPNR